MSFFYGDAEIPSNFTAAGGVAGLGAIAGRLFKGAELDAVAAHARKTAPLTPDILKALDGDVDAAIKAITPIREALAPEARAAIDLHEQMTSERASLVTPSATHDANMDAAIRTVNDPVQQDFTPEIDPAKIDRITAILVPDAPPAPKSWDSSLKAYLVRSGGLIDQKGELKALGILNDTVEFKKGNLTYRQKLVKDKGMPLDRARESAAEAGYFDYIYGNPETAGEKSTIADLLNELENESRRVTQADPDDSGSRYASQQVAELLAIIGPDVDDALVARAIERANRDGIDPVAAFDIVARGDVDQQPDIAGPRQADPMALPDNMPEPDFIDEDEMFSPIDLEDFDPAMEIPFFDDGRPVTAAQMIDDLEEMHGLFQATEVCRL